LSNADDGYVKANDYSLAKQLNNHRVFIRYLRSRPWIGVMLALMFAAIAAAVVLGPSRWPVGRSSSWRVWFMAGTALAAAIYLLVATFSRRRSS